ncbi:MAG: amidohydrolase family protein [Gammaproteobacteria bacterium]|nr:amidohydrolase family protein [Gammaproteobacteria bacterium]MBT5202730.1 amidohydrolase family protein [Gammaproteobacteria bacterium]MBT5603125.1 amidohydrolase family protein [Gammaproteobacteria bacterium]MBT6244000.1 amidohydrolase family protein [Gammaproteobacteria bacterium]
MLRLLFVVLCFSFSTAGGATVALFADAIIDGEASEMITGKAILVEDGKITAILDASAVPAEVEAINLAGMTLMPGMINSHEHPLIYLDDYQNAHLQASSAYKALLGLKTMQRWLQQGWTTIRVMGDADVYYGNQDIRRAIEEGVFVGPRITGAAHYISITGGGGDANYFSPEQSLIADGLIADGPDEIRKAIRNEIKYGSDWIKLMVTGAFHSVGDDPRNVAFSPQELAVAMAEAARHHVPVAAHAHATAGINQAIIAGARSIEHGTYLDDLSMDLMVEHGTYYVPTIYVGDYYAGTDKLLAQEKNDDVYLNYRDEWLRRIGKAHRQGVKIVVGVDLGGYAIAPHVYAREFATLVEAGLSPMQAIKAGTSVAAEMLGWNDRVGTLKAGKLADIIAVPGNPLEDISVLERPQFVMLGGKVVRRSE